MLVFRCHYCKREWLPEEIPHYELCPYNIPYPHLTSPVTIAIPEDLESL